MRGTFFQPTKLLRGSDGIGQLEQRKNFNWQQSILPRLIVQRSAPRTSQSTRHEKVHARSKAVLQNPRPSRGDKSMNDIAIAQVNDIGLSRRARTTMIRLIQYGILQ
jgi:hypothetical protein